MRRQTQGQPSLSPLSGIGEKWPQTAAWYFRQQPESGYDEYRRADLPLSDSVVTTGPQIIVTGGMILAGIAIDQMVKITEARPRLVSSIQDAKNDPDLVRMAKSKSGIGQIETFWSIATVAGRSPPGSFMVAFTPAAQKALK